MISDAVWNLGGPTSYENIKTSQFYTAERSTTTYGNHAATWAGKIGLIYPSDYGYATAGGSDSNRTLCLAQRLDLWDEGNYSPDCKNNDWLLYNKNGQWTITPWSGTSGGVFIIGDYGNVNGNVNAKQESNDYVIVRPSLYLKSSIEITGGYGTKNKPYTLGYNEYKITYDLDGGTVSTNNPTSYTSQSDNIILTNPTKEGYIFKGWTGSNGDTANTSVTINKGSTGDKTYKANWVKTHTITVTAGTGTSVSGGGICEEGSTVSFRGSANSNYIWNGWSDGNSAYSRTTTCDGNKTFTTNAATYNPPTYTTTRTGSNGWVGTYTCKNGTGTITSCSRNGTYCTYGTGGCTGNTNSSYIYTCNPDGVNGGLGGGLSSSISC